MDDLPNEGDIYYRNNWKASQTPVLKYQQSRNIIISCIVGDMFGEVNNLCIIGCGTLGKAIAQGLINSNIKINACVGFEWEVDSLKEALPWVNVSIGENAIHAKDADAILLAVKPHQVSVLQDLPLENKLVISILAGVTTKKLKKYLPESTVVIRAMPNTACLIGEGMTVLAMDNVPEQFADFSRHVFSSVGKCIELDEKHMDTVTALTGSGPAFVYSFIEALADGALSLGLPRDNSIQIASQMVQGAARMVLQGGHPAVLRDRVTTPGGCTIAGLLVLEDGKFKSTVARAIQEAASVCKTLGKNK